MQVFNIFVSQDPEPQDTRDPRDIIFQWDPQDLEPQDPKDPCTSTENWFSIQKNTVNQNV